MENKSDGKFIKGLFCGVLLTLLCFAVMLGFLRWRLTNRASYGQQAQSEDETEAEELQLSNLDIYRKTNEIEYIINSDFTGDIDTQQVEDGIYSGMLEGLNDPYSEYYSVEDMKKMEDSTNGTYSGIGAVLMQDPDSKEIKVVSCYEDTPAAEAGILPGDIITGFQGETLGDMTLTELVSTIRSQTQESISLTLLRDKETIEVTLTPREIEVPTVESRMLQDQIGYLKIVEFDNVTVDQFNEALESLKSQGMEKLIIDVRNNPGGVLQVVCDILDQILPEGLIVYTEDKQGNRSEYSSDEEHKLEIPMVVLINENSASAAEIFAGAIQDYGIGTLVGETTFGKGIVQRIYELADGTGIKLTVAKYYTPKGNDIHEKGIEPDIEEPLDEEAKKLLVIPDEKDNQLQKAIEIID